jgi:hypothetical protein
VGPRSVRNNAQTWTERFEKTAESLVDRCLLQPIGFAFALMWEDWPRAAETVVSS